MKNRDIPTVINILREQYKNWNIPTVTLTAANSDDPLKILISTILSLRTQDKTTHDASKRLFQLADSPFDIASLSLQEIENAIYPVGFYRNKAKNIKHICEKLIENYNSRVPDDIEELIKLKGVGRKTANLVVTLGFNKPGICVDTHVHRISNRWGLISTKSPYETEITLRKKLPRRYWIEYNTLLVSFGQNLCRPVSPRCSTCPVLSYCDRVGVSKNR